MADMKQQVEVELKKRKGTPLVAVMDENCSHVLSGRETYEVMAGEVIYKGTILLEMTPCKLKGGISR